MRWTVMTTVQVQFTAQDEIFINWPFLRRGELEECFNLQTEPTVVTNWFMYQMAFDNDHRYIEEAFWLEPNKYVHRRCAHCQADFSSGKCNNL